MVTREGGSSADASQRRSCLFVVIAAFSCALRRRRRRLLRGELGEACVATSLQRDAAKAPASTEQRPIVGRHQGGARRLIRLSFGSAAREGALEVVATLGLVSRSTVSSGAYQIGRAHV